MQGSGLVRISKEIHKKWALSGWQSPGRSCPGGSYLGGSCPGGSYLGVSYPVGVIWVR